MRYELTQKGKFTLATVSIAFIVLVAVAAFAVSSPALPVNPDTSAAASSPSFAPTENPDTSAPSAPVTGSDTAPVGSDEPPATAPETPDGGSDLPGDTDEHAQGDTGNTVPAQPTAAPVSVPGSATAATEPTHFGELSDVMVFCYFDSDSSSLTEDALVAIAEIVAAYFGAEDSVVVIEGTASPEEWDINPGLAGERVSAVQLELLNRGVTQDSIVTVTNTPVRNSVALQRVDIYVMPRGLK